MKTKLSLLVFLIILLYTSASVSIPKQPAIDAYEVEELKNWGVEKIGAPLLWSKGIKGKGINIAIMDSGIDYNHPEFSKNIHTGYNAIQPNELPIDDYGHGTLMTGIIAAQHNSIGFQGIAPEAEIYPVKVLDRLGRGSLEDINRGIDWCIRHNIDIINMSFSIPEDKELLHKSIQKATNNGIIVVAAVTNSYGGAVGYPASYEGVISVTSVDRKLDSGETASIGKIDFSAPGEDIISTSKNGKFEYVSGTSISAPYVTGLIALLMQQYHLPSNNIVKTLKKYAEDLGVDGKDDIYGWGFLTTTENGG
ncbi:S8 family peptidase [Paenibacillus graminis]|uniref:Peptidase S8/S53 domain-containing protein n=1 Tax=Paenibacillus graminis TaxID=189425 RepID=A0A089MEA0_9BACL|nr:S8 family peptidase [Paenibacillus graminis]AIQ71632.1 hypothetical protein PGRAT_31635 [Paenibacillus graminis]